MPTKQTVNNTKKTSSKSGEWVVRSRNLKHVANGTLTQRSEKSSYTVSRRSGQIIGRTVDAHRDALKRLADR